jgi:ribosome-associated protein
MIPINARTTIPDDELTWTFSRSSGPGGQNVNKVNSKATLHWNFASSQVIPADVRERFVAAYSSRLTTKGDIVIASQEYRDQPKNVAACEERLKQMLLAVWKAPKKRRPTKPSKGSKMRRLQAKKERGEVKRGRGNVRPE